MAQAVEPERGAGSVTFEVERFEPRGRDQLALSGRWFGLRGRRFVRPTLTLGTGGDTRRSLADLEHKPWAAEDGELWEATFPYQAEGGRPRHIELTVAPDITVALPLPGSGASEQQIKARPRRDDLLDNLRGARRDGRPAPGSRNGSDPSRGARSATRREDGLEAQREAPRVPDAPVTAPEPGDADAMALRLSRAQKEIEGLRAELARHDGAKVEAAQAMTRRDAAVGRLTEALSQRDKAARAYERAVRARDQAAHELDRMRKERDRMAKERDQALRDRDRAIAKATKAADAAATRAEHRPVAGAHPAVAGTRAMTSPAVVWAQRVLAVSVLVIVVLAFAITARVL
jgi:tetratricopeptide (TPR) repeat protein